MPRYATVGLLVDTATPGGPRGQLVLRVHRMLLPGDCVTDPAGQPCLRAGWRLPDGTLARGIFVSGRFAAAR